MVKILPGTPPVSGPAAAQLRDRSAVADVATRRTDRTGTSGAGGAVMLGAVFDALPEAALAFDPATGEIRFMNRAAREALAPRAGAAQTVETCGLFASAEVRGRLVERVLAGDGDRHPVEIGGEDFVCSARLAPGEDGGALVVLLLRRDTAEGEREREQMLSVITHELRTPLTSIKGALELLQSGTAGPLAEKAQSLVGIAISNSTRMLDLIREILLLEETRQSGPAINARTVALAPLIDAAVETHQGYAAHLGVTLEAGAIAPDLFVRVDPLRLSQILSNLLSNAAKVSPRGGKVEIGARREGPEAVISVRDHGPGIPEELHMTLFDRFSRSEAAGGRSGIASSGLGLNIVKTLVTKQNGRIRFETEAGKGTTFRVSFALAETPGAG
ncbi:sensor histidine kinase [Celeribacter indicus]|uniref:histidine kinase n=1 Tax=Celeribacter indicus TaxID=1208324 RepID=A0A0B5E7W2_9RHOB|nr:ATP-binding protein [Celeribacter indicus]AJE48387.1 hypothetical protein P73_3672 [Celeribacter indicus]SDW74619.1 His Kinase A (phospho-acceptor) domain-containing protein [Celeribacter indicus]